jgi:hypothetical protein
MFNGLQWHVFVADAHGADAAYSPPSGKPFHKFEVRGACCGGGDGACTGLGPLGPGPCCRRRAPPVRPARALHKAPPLKHAAPPAQVCMTGLCRVAARAFFREGNPDFVDAARTTADTGIAGLVPGADIDDYVFEPW